MANEEVNRIGIELYIEDKTPEGLSQAQTAAEQHANRFGQSLNAALSPAAKKASQSLYEAEKQTNKFDNALKNATDVSGMGAKAVNHLASMFNPFNLALTAVVAGVALLSKTILDAVDTAFNQYNRALEETIKSTKTLADTTAESIEKERLAQLGYTDSMIKAMEIRRQIQVAESALLKAQIEYQTNAGAAIGYNAKNLGWLTGTMDKNLEARRNNIQAIKDTIQTLKQEAEYLSKQSVEQRTKEVISNLPKPKQEVKPGKEVLPTGEPGMFSRWFDAVPNLDEISSQAALVAETIRVNFYEKVAEFRRLGVEDEKDKLQKILDANRTIHESKMALEQAEFDQRQLNMQKMVTTTELVGGIVGGITQTVGKVMQAAIKDENKRAKASAAITATMESIAAAVEVARAIGSYPDPVGIAAHAASAVAHVAAAVLAAKYGGGGATAPTKSAAGAGASEAGAVAPAPEMQKSTMTVIVQGHIYSPLSGAKWVREAAEAGEQERNPGRERSEVV